MPLVTDNLISRSSESRWRILNDSSVTEGLTWDQLEARTRDSRETPYLLLYQKIGQEELEEVLPDPAKLARVVADNTKMAGDQESLGTMLGGNKRGGDGGGGAGPQCRDNFGQMGGGRFVC